MSAPAAGRRGTVKVYTVIYHDARREGAAGDNTHIQRFRSERDAVEFASGREVYGEPCRVDEDDVPRAIAQRWGMA